MVGINDGIIFCYIIGNGVWKFYLFKKSFYFCIEWSFFDNNFIKIFIKNFYCCLLGSCFNFIVNNGYF